MSLLGQTTAVVSLGASCQTARQIRLHAPLLAGRMGEAMEARSFPFDWMFAPPAAVARLLRSDAPVPATVGELVQAQRPFWSRHGIWLWHDGDARGDTAEDFAATRARLTRRWDRFLALRALRRRVFVVSNTQNNLARVPDFAPQRLDFRLTARAMRDIAAGVHGLFGRDGTELLFVAYASRITGDAREAGLPLAIIEPDATEHDGDEQQWAEMFGQFVK